MSADLTAPIDDTHRQCEELRAQINATFHVFKQQVRHWDIAPIPDRQEYP